MTTYMLCTEAQDHQTQLFFLEQLGYQPASLMSLDTYSAAIEEEDRSAFKSSIEDVVDEIREGQDEVFLCGDAQTLFDVLEVMTDRLNSFRILTTDQAINQKGPQEVQP